MTSAKSAQGRLVAPDGKSASESSGKAGDLLQRILKDVLVVFAFEDLKFQRGIELSNQLLVELGVCQGIKMMKYKCLKRE